jgi:UDP-2-acetamido-3-amino-2,3-dideoxy-glucuronate N-acetyltransferase
MSDQQVFISKLAIVELGAVIGKGSAIWEFSKVRSGAVIGENVTIGMGVYIGPGVKIGSNCKIQNGAMIYEPALIGNGVFIGPGVILTNDKHPRAIGADGHKLGFDDWTQVGVVIEDGASLGAGAVCVAPINIGKDSFIAAGAVVTKNVPTGETWIGIPAKKK